MQVIGHEAVGKNCEQLLRRRTLNLRQRLGDHRCVLEDRATLPRTERQEIVKVTYVRVVRESLRPGYCSECLRNDRARVDRSAPGVEGPAYTAVLSNDRVVRSGVNVR